MSTIREITSPADLRPAFDGSFYTILGVDNVQEYVEGYTRVLAKAGIGEPTEWWSTVGAVVNLFAVSHHGTLLNDRDLFKPDLGIVLFPLDGLNPARLPLFKIEWGDRWFDDIIGNMRRAG